VLPQVLEQVCDVLTGWNLYDIMTNPRASHVARRLLSVAAGRDVSPPSTKKVCGFTPRCAAWPGQIQWLMDSKPGLCYFCRRPLLD